MKASTVNNKYLPTIRTIPDELWDELKKILPREKPPKTVGRPVVPYRKVLDGILYVLRTGCQWKKMLPNQYGSGSVCHRRFQEGINWMYLRKHGSNCWEHMMIKSVSTGHGNPSIPYL